MLKYTTVIIQNFIKLIQEKILALIIPFNTKNALIYSS
ncbi:MAG: hypothetical protein PG977_001148 [Bartonella clarridgeiae]|nr:MAG: hypothetical protein PG977_001148 [Bartonella clarridgeiae]